MIYTLKAGLRLKCNTSKHTQVPAIPQIRSYPQLTLTFLPPYKGLFEIIRKIQIRIHLIWIRISIFGLFYVKTNLYLLIADPDSNF